MHADEATQDRLGELLDDKDLAVQRAASEALVAPAQSMPAEKARAAVGLARSLRGLGRRPGAAAGAARPVGKRAFWKHAKPRVFIAGAVALLAQARPSETVDARARTQQRAAEGYLTDDDFLDLLRVIQLALLKGQVAADERAELRAQLAEEYPSRDPRMNRELVRLLVYLQEPTFAERLVEQLNSDVPSVEKMQIADARPLLAGRLDRCR